MKSESPQDRHGKEIVRRLRSVARIPGLLHASPEGIHLAVRKAGSIRQPAWLASLLRADQLGPLTEWSQALEAREIIDLDVSLLSRWSYRLGQLERDRDLDRLIDAGVRSLRRYRGRDLRAEWQRNRSLIERYGVVLRALPAAVPFLDGTADSPTAEQCWAALPVRLFCLADWRIDPISGLRPPSALPGERATRASDDEPLLAVLRAVLIAQQTRLTAPATHAGPPVAGRYRWAFEAARTAPTYSPVLLARALVAETSIPALRGVPGHALALLARTAERTALVAGPTTGLAALARLAEPLAERATAIRRKHRRLDRFLRLCRGQRLGHVNREERTLRQRLRKLPGERRARARGLVQVFLAWVRNDEARPVSRRRLLRAVLASDSSSLTTMGQTICAVWRASGAAIGAGLQASTQGVGDRAQAARLTVSLLHPELRWPLREPPKRKQLGFLVDALKALDEEGVALLGSELLAMAEQGRLNAKLTELLEMDLPPELVRRVLAADVIEGAVDLTGPTRDVSRYLDSVELLRSLDEPPPWLEEEWFLHLFDAGRAWSSALILALVAHSKSRDESATSSGALFAISQALAIEDQDLAAALEAWATVRLEQPPPELEPLAQVLDLPLSDLAAYLHYRRLCGQGEAFSSTVLAPLQSEQKRQRQIAFLEARRSSGNMPENLLESTLGQLTDEHRARRRNEAKARRARNTLRRALETYRQDSLAQALEAACRKAATRILGRKLPDQLPTGFQQSFHLLHSDDTDLDLFRAFLGDLIAGQPLDLRPENRAWLERATANGIETAAWLEGLRCSLEIEGQTITFETEKDPLHALRMGSYFNTCLTLEGGFNASSTLTNALDVNKQVIFGRRVDGTVVARKLIGATAGGELAGYYTYASEHREPIRRHLAAELRGFAERCGLRLSDRATPENLHRGFWWNDGNEAWPHASEAPARLSDPPPDGPGDDDAKLEWNLRQALMSRDPELLAAVANSAEGANHGYHYSDVAAHRLLRQAPASADALQPDSVPGWRLQRIGQILTAEGRLEWLAAAQRCTSYLDRGEALLSALPSEPGSAARIANQIRAGSPPEPEELHRPPMTVADLSPAAAVGLLSYCARRNRDVPFDEPWQEDVAAVVTVAYLKQSPGSERSLLCRELARSAELEEVTLIAAQQIAMPELAPWLRKALGTASRSTCAPIALALGRIGDPRDADRLSAALHRWPDNLGLAVAVARCGLGELARELWQPPLDIQQAAEPSWLELVCELDAPKVGRRLRRELTRASLPYNSSRVQQLLSYLAELGLTGFAPQDLTDEIGETWSNHTRRRLPELQARWQAQRNRQECHRQQREPQQPDGPTSSLDTRGTQSPPDPASLHTALERVAAHRGDDPPPELSALLTLPPDWIAPTTSRQILALAEPWAERLPIELCQAAIRLARSDLYGSFSISTGMIVRRWLGWLPIDQRALSFVQTCWVEWKFATPGLIHLLLLLDDDPELCPQIIKLYPQKFPGSKDALFYLLDLALTWLEPETAEAFAEGVCARLDPRTLNLADFQVGDEPFEASYRLHQLMLRYLVRNVSAKERQTLVEQAKAVGSRRGKWLAAQIT